MAAILPPPIGRPVRSPRYARRGRSDPKCPRRSGDSFSNCNDYIKGGRWRDAAAGSLFTLLAPARNFVSKMPQFPARILFVRRIPRQAPPASKRRAVDLRRAFTRRAPCRPVLSYPLPPNAAAIGRAAKFLEIGIGRQRFKDDRENGAVPRVVSWLRRGAALRAAAGRCATTARAGRWAWRDSRPCRARYSARGLRPWRRR